MRAAVFGRDFFGQQYYRILSEKIGKKNVSIIDRVQDCHKADVLALSGAGNCTFQNIAHAMRKGVHVIAEQITDATPEKVKTIQGLSGRFNLKVAMGGIEQFNPVVRKAKELLGTDKIISMEAVRFGPHDPSRKAHILYDIMVHDLPVIGLLNPSPILGVKAFSTNITDNLTVFLRHKHGTSILRSSRSPMYKERRFAIYAQKSTIEADYIKQEILFSRVSSEYEISLAKIGYLSKRQVFIEKEEPLKAMISDFLDSIGTKRNIMPWKSVRGFYTLCTRIEDNLNIGRD